MVPGREEKAEERQKVQTYPNDENLSLRLMSDSVER
jgi:hypothetical protein